MIVRIVLAVALVVAAALAFAHPAPRRSIETVQAAATVLPPFDELRVTSDHRARRSRPAAVASDLVVYVAGAVKRPGLYHLHAGDRYARAVDLAGGLSPQADAAGVNLAQLAGDGDEVDVPVAGQASYGRSSHRQSRTRSRRRVAPAAGSVDINAADAAELGAVPGIGRAVGQRVVELRRREGPFASIDELLDVAGMTQGRLERARPYLRPP